MTTDTIKLLEEALTSASGDLQFWIEHNRGSDFPMIEIGQKMLVTRHYLNAALAHLAQLKASGPSDGEMKSDWAYLIGTQKCPVLFDGKLAFVSVPGVSRKAFELAKQRAHEKLADIAMQAEKEKNL